MHVDSWILFIVNVSSMDRCVSGSIHVPSKLESVCSLDSRSASTLFFWWICSIFIDSKYGRKDNTSWRYCCIVSSLASYSPLMWLTTIRKSMKIRSFWIWSTRATVSQLQRLHIRIFYYWNGAFILTHRTIYIFGWCKCYTYSFCIFNCRAINVYNPTFLFWWLRNILVICWWIQSIGALNVRQFLSIIYCSCYIGNLIFK